HIRFLALTGNLTRGLALFERHLADALGQVHEHDRFDFFLAVQILLERLAEEGTVRLALRLPARFPAYRPEGRYATADLLDWFTERSVELARGFDARNGNDFHARRLSELPGLKALARELPLPAVSDGEGVRESLEFRD